MKRIYYLCGICLMLFSCNKITMEQYMGHESLSLTVINVDAQDTLKYTYNAEIKKNNAEIKKSGFVTINISNNDYFDTIHLIHLKIGEELKLITTLPTYFADMQCSIEYQLFDVDTVIKNEPYSFSYQIPNDAISHSYEIFWSATSPTWDEDSKCEGNVSIVIDH